MVGYGQRLLTATVLQRSVPATRILRTASSTAIWLRRTGESAIIIAILFFIVVNFYIFASVVSLNTFVYIFLILSALTDGLYIAAHLVRRRVKHERVSCDPSKVTVLIACYNGEKMLGETIRQAALHVPKKQIIVVSDASTDNTAKLARSAGVQVVENRKNLNKPFSISSTIRRVRTPYVLLLDDDVLIGRATIPTSLLDEGYTAVAFKVVPVEENSLVNKLQAFEYRNSMHLGKNLRGKVAAVGNVSGAIGLYRTKDLLGQVTLHSGQFAGEDEQRTILAHIYGSGKGVTYVNEQVLTRTPKTLGALYRQRAYSWSLAVPELFTLYWRLLFSPRYHYLLKAEKAYYLYIYLTDPLRMLFFWALILRPSHMLLTYAFYFFLNILVWLRTGLKDSFGIVLLYPLYKLWLILCRFVGNFYWLKVKAGYIRRRLYKRVTSRRLMREYALVTMIFAASTGISLSHFISDMRLFSHIQTYRLEETAVTFEYDSIEAAESISPQELNLQISTDPPADGTYTAVGLEKGDTTRALAHKAVDEFTESRPELKVPYVMRWEVDARIKESLTKDEVYMTGTGLLLIDSDLIEGSIKEVTESQRHETGL